MVYCSHLLNLDGASRLWSTSWSIKVKNEIRNGKTVWMKGKKIYSLVHAKTVRLPRRCVKTRFQFYIGAICHCHRCIDGILLSSSANMVGASWLQGISWRTKANQKGKNILNEWYSVGSRGGAKAPSLFLDQTKIRRAEKKNSGACTPPPPPPPPYLKVWNRHWWKLIISFCNQLAYLWNNFPCVLSKF